MTTAVLTTHVAAYAAAVRRHLGDLSPEQVEDLTDGLEADLAEALDDPSRPITGEIPLVTGAGQAPGDAPTEKLPLAGATSAVDLTVRFGSPEAYAEELRSAAGLPPALPGAPARRRRTPVGALRARTGAAVAAITAHPRWPAVRDFLVSLRPVWWVARGWALFFVVAGIFGLPFGIGTSGFVGFLLLSAAVVVSVQHGRGIWSAPERFAGAVRVLNVLAVIMLPVALSVVDGPDGGYVDGGTYVVETTPVEDGVYLDGEPVENLFVYGVDGLPVDGARIVDEDLRPVAVGGAAGMYDDEDHATVFWEPRVDAQGRDVWNAYPLATWTVSDGDWTGADAADSTDAVVPAPPVAQLAALAPAAGSQGAATDPVDPTTGATAPAADAGAVPPVVTPPVATPPAPAPDAAPAPVAPAPVVP